MVEIIFVFICIIPAIFVCLLQFYVFRNAKRNFIKLLPLMVTFITFITLYTYEHFAEASLTITWVIEWFIPGCLLGILLALISRKIRISYIFLTLLSLYTLFIVFYNIWAPAEVFYEPFRVEYEDSVYIEYKDADDTPYKLLFDDSYEEKEKHFYIKSMLIPFDYITPYSEKFDKDYNFVWIKSYDDVLVKKKFVLPTIESNKVDEVWMSRSSSYEIIKDKETVDKIVKCAKSNVEIELDKEIVDYKKKHSWDNHCFYLKYKDLPIIEEYHICEIEDGKYIIEQYTPEEYAAPFWENVTH